MHSHRSSLTAENKEPEISHTMEVLLVLYKIFAPQPRISLSGVEATVSYKNYNKEGDNMDRRDFIKAVALSGLSLATLGCSKLTSDSPITQPSAKPPAPGVPDFDLTIVQGIDPEGLLNRGFKAIGGIENYVRKDANVVIKPNFSVPRTPEEAATTNTTMVAALVKMCLGAGAREVKVVDQPLQFLASFVS